MYVDVYSIKREGYHMMGNWWLRLGGWNQPIRDSTNLHVLTLPKCLLTEIFFNLETRIPYYENNQIDKSL